MKKSEFKKQIREEILSTLMEKKKKEEETPEVEETPEETEEVETTTDTIEEPSTDSFGVDPKITKLQSALKAAYDAAKEMNDEKLVTQIGNTITYFTRAHIVTDEKPAPVTELKKYIREIIKQHL